MDHTPLRRSRRGQPLVDLPQTNCIDSQPAITGDPIYKRPTERQDLFEPEAEFFENNGTNISSLETHFFQEFSMNTSRVVRTYGRSKRRPESGGEVFKVGDTVLVDTNAKQPSVAVIAAIWRVQPGNIQPYIRVLVHWFIRPVELAGVRANRDHLEVSISLFSFHSPLNRMHRTKYIIPCHQRKPYSPRLF